MPQEIAIKGAREHNLQDLTVSIPRDKLVVLTGLSGSGKSTLAFDIIHREGQRQYLESLGMVTDYVSRPRLDSISGLSPAISVDQHLTNRSPRSTVGTATEVYTYLRVLFARLGRRPCPACGQEAPPPMDVAGVLEEEGETGAYPCPACGAAVPGFSMAHFSFNKPTGACPACTGLGTVHEADLSRLFDEERPVIAGGVRHWEKFHEERYPGILQEAGRHFGFVFDPHQPIKDLGPCQRDLLLYGTDSPEFLRHFPGRKPPAKSGDGRFEGVVTNFLRRYTESAGNAGAREKLEAMLVQRICPDCGGARLRPEARAAVVAGMNITALAELPLTALAAWLEALPGLLSPEENVIAAPILADLAERLRRLGDVGVGYLTLARATPSLSAGEAQRLRLSALLGSGLSGVIYVLDEPTMGLHPRDNPRLIEVLRQLRDLGNTVLVIEHDLELIRAADYVLDIGPGAGKQGGRLVVAGTPREVAESPVSITGAYLAGISAPAPPARRRKPEQGFLRIKGASAHNLKAVDADIPLGLFTVCTGVSGSGKSSLIFDVLERAARMRFFGAAETPGAHDAILGWEALDKVITMDQTPIGRTPRSNAATYTDVFTPIRELYAGLAEARQRGLGAAALSFNVPGGRCERCQGAGLLTVAMHFLPDVQVRCPACGGRRFTAEVLAVKHRGYDICEVLEMTVAEALTLFAETPAVAARLKLLADVGLGYISLGQPATTFSGGEAQRIKLAKELGRKTGERTLYLLDEPTIGLHPADTARLLEIFARLTDAGHTLVVIEHNPDVAQAADWLIDLGPEGGAGGGRLIIAGTPEVAARCEESEMGRVLRSRLAPERLLAAAQA